MRSRPDLFTSYEADGSPLNTTTKRAWFAAMLVFLVILPFQLDNELNALMATAFFAAIAAIGLNLVTGLAGQISLGHAFFLGLGAYTGASLAGDTDSRLFGLGLDMAIWLPAAGIVAGLVGVVVAPVATRLRGQYLAIVTLGLVFLGEHLFRELRDITGGAGVGRAAPDLVLFGADFGESTTFAGLEIDRTITLYFFGLVMVLFFGLLAKNLTRSAVGRAFAAVRDRDVAAELMGVPLTKYKLIAFGVSSFYAGIAGAMLSTVTGFIEPGTYSLFFSIQFLAMILIGGVGTLAGALLGAAFVTLLPRLVQEVPGILPFIESGTSGGFLTTFQLQTIIYGSLIVIFLILEPRGLFGLWVRVRNYFRAWPFSY